MNRAQDLDSYIGLKLPRLMRDAGFSTPEVRTNQIVLLRGTGRRFWEITLREAADILAAEASTHDELESICAEMRTIADDDSILLMLARVTQVWARV